MLMEKYFGDTYDAAVAASLYKLHISGNDKILDKLLEAVCPLIRIVFKREISKSADCHRSTLEGDALEHLFLVFSASRLGWCHQESASDTERRNRGQILCSHPSIAAIYGSVYRNIS